MNDVETGTYTPVIVLVTGFGAFPGAHSNPTSAILKKIERQQRRFGRLGIRISAQQIPVIYDGIASALRTAVAASQPDVILHLGLASRRRAISIETRALNRANPLHPDAARRRTSQHLMESGAASLRSTFPAARLVAAVRRVWPATACSIDAGDYVCNATLYRSLAERFSPCIGFIHVPRPCNPAQPLRRRRRPRPSLNVLTQAAVAAILVCARDARRLQGHGAFPASVPDAPPGNWVAR